VDFGQQFASRDVYLFGPGAVLRIGHGVNQSWAERDMQSFWKATAVTGLLAAACAAQTSTDQRSLERPAGQRRAAGGEPRPGRPAAIFERLGSQLGLDEAQKKEYDQLVAVYREKLEAQRQGQAEASEFVRQMREARQAGDDEKVRQLREQMRNRRGGDRDPMQAFFDDVEKILRDDQKEKLGDLRERLVGPGMRGGPRPRPFVAPEQQIDKLRTGLELSAEQQSTFDSLAADLIKRLGADGQPSIAELMQQLRETYASGDREEAARLRKILGERRAAVDKAMSEFAAQLEPTLTDVQKGYFAEFREQALRGMGPRATADGGSLRDDPRMLLRAVKRLELSQEQKDQVRKIEADASKRIRGGGKDGAASLRAELDKQLRAILTPEQITQLDKILARQQQRGAGEKKDASPKNGSARPRSSAGDGVP
jgi:Spy/CpxP family protein refolding chaperone